MAAPININTQYIYCVTYGKKEKTIAQGISITKYEEEKQAKQSWGCVNWFDKVAGYLRSLEIKEAPHIYGNDIQLLDSDNLPYFFQYVNKEIYSDEVRKLLPQSPELLSTEEAQRYLTELNPYG
jgi:hypothetical protein